MEQPDVQPSSLYPVTFTERRKALLLTALRSGQTVKAACARAGVSPATVYRHLAQDAAFQEQVERAKGEAEAKLIDAITKAAHSGETVTTPGGKVTVMPGDWKAAAWLLEHHPQTREQYAGILRQKVALGQDPDAGPVELDVSTDSMNTMERMAAVVTVLQRAGVMPIPEPGQAGPLLLPGDDPDGTPEAREG